RDPITGSGEKEYGIEPHRQRSGRLFKHRTCNGVYLLALRIGKALTTLYEVVLLRVRVLLLEDVLKTRPFIGELRTELVYGVFSHTGSLAKSLLVVKG